MTFSHKKYQNFNDKLKKTSLQSMVKSYSGEYKNDLFNGKGRLELTDSSIYEGEFKNNKINGYGKIFFKDGSIYQGEFKNNLMDGKGILRDKEGNTQKVIYHKGIFKDVQRTKLKFVWRKTFQGTIELNVPIDEKGGHSLFSMSNENLLKKSKLDKDKENMELINIIDNN